ncbi:MAG: hypothetical protein Q9163_005119 [Psora crenata]
MQEYDKELANRIVKPVITFMRAQTDKVRREIHGPGAYSSIVRRTWARRTSLTWPIANCPTYEINPLSLLCVLVRFSKNIRPTDKVLQAIQHVERNCSKHLSVVNDIYSWEKEVESSRTGLKEGAALCSVLKVIAESKRFLTRGWDLVHDEQRAEVEKGLRVIVSVLLKLPGANYVSIATTDPSPLRFHRHYGSIALVNLYHTMINLPDILTHPAVIISTLLFVLKQIYDGLSARSETPAGLPWVGLDENKLFAETRAHLSGLTNVREWLSEGYHKYSKRGKSYIIPDFSGKPEIVLPRTQIPWLVAQPEDVLSAAAWHYDSLEGDFAFTRKKLLQDPYHEAVIHKYLPRRLPALIPELWDEVARGFDESWGLDTHTWKEIPLYDSLMYMISRAVNRMLVGLPLCRNEDYLSNMRHFAMDIIKTGVMLRFTPRWLRPVVGRLVTIPNHLHYRNTAKYTIPLITERLEQFRMKEQNPDYDWVAPNDFLSWSIMLATAEGRQDELTVDMLSRRLMPLNFAAIHTTAISITNLFLDLLASEPSLHYLEGIRQEAAAILSEENGQWTKAGLARCHRADSAMRESMRVNNFMSRNVLRKVLLKGGIHNQAEGWHASQGTIIGIDMQSIQHDADIYTDPDTYDPFRFSRSKEKECVPNTENPADANVGDGSNHLEQKNTGLVNTSDVFLPFSHGRHACPGRFFVAAEVKMMLSYLLLNYDVEPLASRPPNLWFGTSSVPPTKATIRVRRKEGSIKV